MSKCAAVPMYDCPVILDHQGLAMDLAPSCMYAVNPVYNDIQGNNTADGLKTRQDGILSALAQLREKVNRLDRSAALGIGGKGGLDASSGSAAGKKSAAADVLTPLASAPKSQLALFASPTNPPYATLALLQKMGSGAVQFECHIHSSLASAKQVKQAKETQAQLEELKFITNVTSYTKPSSTAASSSRVVKVWLVWKDIESSELRPTPHACLVGDSTIARYLCRLYLPALYDEEDQQNHGRLLAVDMVLDCLTQANYVKAKELGAAFKNVNTAMGGLGGDGVWMFGNAMTLADVALLAYIQARDDVKKVATGCSNIKKWFARVQ
eukprot:Nk52_evm16s150 gene=Nk52_evmTU16s150